ncbi:hypothetical protein [Lentzea albidocapillata]|nr:hypothetical protein [Lentzea albidocapillata]
MRDWMFLFADLLVVDTRVLASVLPPNGNVLDRPHGDHARS